jgi:cell division protease FtsH
MGAAGYVAHEDPAHRYVRTRNQMLDDLCVLMGGREAELLLLNDLTWGASHDLQQATKLAREMLEVYGMGDDIGPMCFRAEKDMRDREPGLSPAQREQLDRAVRKLLDDAHQRAAKILHDNREVLENLRDLLVRDKVIYAKTLTEMTGKKK